jgi:predicted ATPase
VGSHFELAELAQLADGTAATLAVQLQPALDKGLLMRVRSQNEAPTCRWSHDRTQQAAYSLIPPRRSRACICRSAAACARPPRRRGWPSACSRSSTAAMRGRR